MANELKLFAEPATQSGLTVTANVYDGLGVSIGDGIACSEVGSLAIYLGDMPTAAAGRYYIRFFSGVNLLTQVVIDWNGTEEITPVSGVNANIKFVNDVAVTGNGRSGSEWGPSGV